jgi:hypothetical protein
MQKLCYYQGCKNKASTKEHVPPKAFFPKNLRNQLITVSSCEKHNNEKSHDDQYVLAHICMNSSPKNRSQELFLEKVLPQLKHNGAALGKLISKDCKPVDDGIVAYQVDVNRLDRFFNGLSYGIIYKTARKRLPDNYQTRHVYHNLHIENISDNEKSIVEEISKFYSGVPGQSLKFGDIKTENKSIYTAKILGKPNFQSSITIVHEFFGHFKVTSMLTNFIKATQY